MALAEIRRILDIFGTNEHTGGVNSTEISKNYKKYSSIMITVYSLILIRF